jgi:hypothetical protein
LGAFFLFDKAASVSRQSVQRVFQAKGFGAPKEFDLDTRTLWLYRKQLVDDDNYLVHDDGSALFVTGTVVYRDLSYRESLQALFQDFQEDRLDLGALLGSFCLIFYADRQIRLLTDRLCMHHIFLDDNISRLSTSFLALLASFSSPQPLNRLGFYERIATGYNVGPDTLIAGIRQLTPQLQSQVSTDSLSFVTHPPLPRHVTFSPRGFMSCVESQLSVLRDYFKKVAPLATRYGADVGLSGGYDSRLLLLLLRDAGLQVSAHTHLTEDVHEQERRIAKRIAQATATELRTVKTRKLELHDEEALARIVRDGLYYYDARSGDNSGAFAETYTRRYKITTLGGQCLRFNGEGGELYRNYYHTALARVDYGQWMKNHIYYPFLDDTIKDRRLRLELHRYVVAKQSARLGVDLSGSVDRLTTRRYYGEIHLPDAEGALANADNQVAFFLMPFAEAAIVERAYQATPHIGVSARLQATMIAELDREVASITSHYGFPFTKEPLVHWMSSAVKGYVPDRIWNARRRLRVRYRDLGRRDLEAYERLHSRSEIIQQIEEALMDCAPEVNWRAAMRSQAQRATVMLVGSFLREFSGCIRP